MTSISGISFKKRSGEFDNLAFDKTSENILNNEEAVVKKNPQNGAKLIAPGDKLHVVGLTYTVNVWNESWWRCGLFRGRTKRVILSNINMMIPSGEITAILGNSGSGKTTLLDIIASRVDGSVEGKVLFRRKKLTEHIFQDIAGYVIQADRTSCYLTVRETLMYTAQLKFGTSKDKLDIEKRVDEAIMDMGLRQNAESQVSGAAGSGLSGSERRRLSIAIQLLQDPAILLLDEPTTGLDSFTAHYLIVALAELAHKRNKIVLLSIHQPRSDIFNLVDNIGILSTGKFIYYGPRKQMVPYMTDIGHPCPTYANPLDHYIDLASIDRLTEEKERLTAERIQMLCEKYQASEIFSNMAPSEEGANDYIPTKIRKPILKEIAKFFSVVSILFRRMNVDLLKGRSALIARTMTLFSLAFLLWLAVFRLKTNLSSIQDRLGILYQSVVFTATVSIINGVSVFPVMRDLYFREARDGLYGSGGFLVAYFLHIIPYQMISSLLWSVLIFWGVGLNADPPSRFGIYYAVILLQHYLGEIVIVIFLGLIQSPSFAQGVTTLLFSASAMYAGGILKAHESLLPPLKYMAYGSFFWYSSEIVAANELHNFNFTCTPEEELTCRLVTGDVILDGLFPGSAQNMDRNFYIMIGFLVGMWFFAGLAFKLVGYRNLN